MTIPQVTLGQGVKVGKQGFGCMSLSAGFYGAAPPCSEETAISIIQTAVSKGATVLSTADFYGNGANEEIIGKALKGLPRESFQIADKWGPIFEAGKPPSFDSSRAAGMKRIDATLRRLGLDFIDVWILRHGGVPLDLDETIGVMKEALDSGKVKAIGVSEMAPADIRAAHKICPISVVEMEWSLFSRDCEAELVPTCRELGIGFLAYSPLGRGLLTGAFKMEDLKDGDFRAAASGTYYAKDSLEANLKLVEAVRKLADAKGVTPGQLALAWVHHRGKDVVPIPGTKNLKYLEINLVAATLDLSDADLQALDEAVPKGSVAGERYPGGHGTFSDNKTK